MFHAVLTVDSWLNADIFSFDHFLALNSVFIFFFLPMGRINKAYQDKGLYYRHVLGHTAMSVRCSIFGLGFILTTFMGPGGAVSELL